jgi:hypothetical protein
LKNNELPPRKGPNTSRETYVLNLLAITAIPYLSLYRLVTHHWKGFEERYNFVVGSISIRTHMQKL